MTQNLFATLHYPEMHSHTKFGIPISKNIRDMHRTQRGTNETTERLKTRSEVKVSKILLDTLPSQDASTHQIWEPYLKEYRRYMYAPDVKLGGQMGGGGG